MNTTSVVTINDSIATQLLKAVFSIYLVVTVVVTSIHMAGDYMNSQNSVIEELCTLQEIFEPALARSIWDMNLEQINSTLDGVYKVPVVVGIKVITDDGDILKIIGDIINEKGEFISINSKGQQVPFEGLSNLFYREFPIIFYDVRQSYNVGKMTIYSSSSIVFNKVKFGFLFILVNSVIKTVVLWLLFLWISRKVLGRPLAKLTDATKHLSLDELENIHIDVGIKKRNELKVLEDAFNIMIKKLSASKKILQQSEEKYRGIFENSIEGIFQESPTGYFIDVNHAMVKMLGYDSKNELLSSTTDTTNLCYVDFKNRKNTLKQLTEENSVISDNKIQLRRKNNTVFWGSESIRPVYNEKKQLLYYEGFLVDITERMEKEKALRDNEIAQAAALARREFLDNSGEGFLSFGKDLLINKEYSRECKNIFNQEIGGTFISELLYPKNLDQKKHIEKNISLIFFEKNRLKLNLYLSLLPLKFQIAGKYIEAQYQFFPDKQQIMLILTDVTKQKKIENELEAERVRLKFVVCVVNELDDFFEILDEFNIFCKEQFPLLTAKTADFSKTLPELYRCLHTFKGLFAQQGFLYLPKVLHQMEDYLSQILKKTTNKPDNICINVENLLEEYNCEAILKQDISIIEKFLGEDFMENKGNISVNKEHIKTIITNIEKLPDIYPKEIKKIFYNIQTIGYLNLNNTLNFYLKGAIELAERLEKMVYPSKVQGDKIFLKPEIYTPFVKTLVHVFRNMVDHGIEFPDEREEFGKDEQATITSTVKRNDTSVIITITDDGRGIDITKLKEIAVKRGVYSEEEISYLSEEEILYTIFNDHFSIREEVTELSGRGVGLSSVKAELDKIYGIVEITTILGKGTTFRFVIPSV